MGLLKDIYDIIRQEPGARKWCERQATASWKILSPKFFPKKLTPEDRLTQLQAIIDGLNSPEFPRHFHDKIFLYLELLLAQIGTAIELKERGVIISQFYVPEYIFYFPPTRAPFQLRRTDDEYDRTCTLTKGESEEYTFYGIRNPRREDIADLKKELDHVVRNRGGKPEEEAFLKLLKAKEMPVETFGLIAEKKRNNSFGFFRDTNALIYNRETLWLIWEETGQTREAIAADLKELLEFRRL